MRHCHGVRLMTQPSVPTAVILAAGGSTRMGRPKGLLRLAGRPVLLHHVQTMDRVVSRVVVVLGSEADRLDAVLPPSVTRILNRDWATTWPADSLRLALLEAGVIGRCLVLPVDTPPARTATLLALLRHPAPAVPVGPDGRRGHPVLVGPEEVQRIRAGAPPGGLRTLLSGAAEIPVEDPLVSLDFDDPEAWDRVARAWTASRGLAPVEGTS